MDDLPRLLLLGHAPGGLSAPDQSEIDAWMATVAEVMRPPIDNMMASIARMIGPRAPVRKRPRRVAAKIAARNGAARFGCLRAHTGVRPAAWEVKWKPLLVPSPLDRAR